MTIVQLKEAARGYLYLKMPEDALSELARVNVSEGFDTEFMDLKLAAEMMLCRWNEAVITSSRLCKRSPKKVRYFIHAAYCLHETGDSLQAKKVLLAGPKELIEEPLFHYNMACYLCALDQPEQAKYYLDKALTLDPELEKTAMSDKDLEFFYGGG